MWSVRLGGWTVKTDERRQPPYAWGKPRSLIAGQVFRSDACHLHGICVCQGMCPGYNCSKIEQEVQNKTKAADKAAARECRLGERISFGESSELSRKAPAPGTERHHKQVMDGSCYQAVCCVSMLHPHSKMSRTGHRPVYSSHQAHGQYPLKQRFFFFFVISS